VAPAGVDVGARVWTTAYRSATQSVSATAAGGGALLPGFNATVFARNDDGSYPCTGLTDGDPGDSTCPNGPTPVTLPFVVDWFGQPYTSVYLNNNGNITFGQPYSESTPSGMNQLRVPMIAAFWADVDTRTGPVVKFGAGSVNGEPAFGFNWLGVGCYDTNNSVADYFQLVLIDRSDLGAGDIDIEFNYGPIAWDSGQSGGGDGRCLGGTAARAGYTSGFGVSYELPGSGVNGGFLSTNSQTGLQRHAMGSEGSGSTPDGRYVFAVRNGGYPNGPGYVAMGDSYSSGYGTGDSNLAGTPCDRSTSAWPLLMSAGYPAAPYLAANVTPSSPDNAFLACTGATTSDLLLGDSSKGYVSQITELQNYEHAHGDPGLITVTIGGNDLGFESILAGCYIGGPLNCIAVLDNRIHYLESGSFTAVLKTTFSAIEAAAGNAQVVVVGYPFLFPIATLTNETYANLHCPWLRGDAHDVLAQFENGQLNLDAVMREAAAEVGVRFVTLDDVFAGHELCTGDAYINPIGPGQPGHPDAVGQHVIAGDVARQLGYLPGSGGAANGSRAGPSGTKHADAGRTAKPSRNIDKNAPRSGARLGESGSGRTALPSRTSSRSNATPLGINFGMATGMTWAPYFGFLWAGGGHAPYRWTVSSGSLPSGLTLDAGTGIISGTSTASGRHSFAVTATDSSSPPLTASAPGSITIRAVPSMSVQPSTLPVSTVGRGYGFPLEATGGFAPYSWSVSAGHLPAGLSLDTSSGALTGTPTAPGGRTFTVTASDSAASDGVATHADTASATYTLNVIPAGSAFTLATPVIPGGHQGAEFDAWLNAAGGRGRLYWSAGLGALPDGLTLDPGTGEITGIPTGHGTYEFTADVQEASIPPRTAKVQVSVTVTADQSLVVPAKGLLAGQADVSYEDAIDTSGGLAPYRYAVTSGQLPRGLSLDAASGSITGAATAAGAYPFVVTVADSATPTPSEVSQGFTIAVADPPTGAAMTVYDTVGGATVGTPYGANIVPDGGIEPYSFQAQAGSLPNGVTLDPASGTLSGVPKKTGTYSATITVTDSSAPTPQSASDSFSIIVNEPNPLAIATSSLPDGSAGSSYVAPIEAVGGTGPYSYAITNGALPSGLGLDPASGNITGTPAAAVDADFTVTATDSSVGIETANASLSLKIGSELPVTIVTKSLENASQGVGYSQILAAAGGTQPYTFAITTGALPAGINIDPNTGVISGTATDTGTSTFTLEAHDSSQPAQSTTESLALAVNAAGALSITSTTLLSGLQGVTYSAALDTGGGTSRYSWSLSSGALPAGLALSSTGVISGTPSGSGTSTFMIEVADSSTPTPQTTTQRLSIEIVPSPFPPPPVLPESPITLLVPLVGAAGIGVAGLLRRPARRRTPT
jgi:lysophospholipase L1-like esterase